MKTDKKLICANWKMNPQTLSEAERWFSEFNHELKNKSFDELELIVAPPLVYLESLKKHLPKGASLTAQNISWLERGALTGETSGLMLKNLGCEYVIIGHSERRWQLGETDKMINLKLKAALAYCLRPILAVGEREKGDDPAAILWAQLKAAFESIPALRVKDVAIAYEPVWAIGTGVADTPDDVLSASLIIRKIINNLYGKAWATDVRILYGGSVTEKNISDFVNQEGINGALIGGASLEVQSFIKLLERIK